MSTKALEYKELKINLDQKKKRKKSQAKRKQRLTKNIH